MYTVLGYSLMNGACWGRAASFDLSALLPLQQWKLLARVNPNTHTAVITLLSLGIRKE